MSAPELLLEALDEVRNEDLKRFQFFLNMKVLDGCKPVPKGRLENQSRSGTVEVMIDCYGEASAVAVTNVILEKMGFNNIRRNLMQAYEGAANCECLLASSGSSPVGADSPYSPTEGKSSACSSNVSASSSPAPPPPPATITMSPQERSVVIAPTVTGGSIGTLNVSITNQN